MCGRVTLTVPDVQALAAQLEARVLPSDAPKYRPRYNAAPSDQHFIVLLGPGGAGFPGDGRSPQGGALESRVLVPAVWGFQGGLINARAETAERKFAAAFTQRRAIVPADGFFEWTGPRDDRRPLWFRPRAGGLLQLAGLVEELPDGRLGFVILTTDASGAVAQVHDRMPVILPPDAARLWLQRPDAGLLVPAPDDFLTATEVSRKVNDVKNDDPSVLQPPEPRPRQLGLFQPRSPKAR